jgi:mono/diheme cytochrome c family protein
MSIHGNGPSWRQIAGVFSLLFMSTVASADPALDIAIGGVARHFERDALLARPDVVTVPVPNDVAYGKPMTFRAIPLAALLAEFQPPPDSVLETIALDGFAAQLPLDLVANADPAKAVAWLAIEPASAPWPVLPGKSVSALVATVRSEQWPYQIAKLASQPSPAARWPALGVDPSLPANDPVRAGQNLFVVQCLPCHTLNGAGAGTLGPDLNRPMNPTAYLTRTGLHALIRDPRSVRNWPDQKMPPFSMAQISDREIDLVIDYLAHMAGRPASP